MDYKNLLRQAYSYALNSPDPSTQNGAILINENRFIGWGCNTFPRGVESKSARLERPTKYSFVEHAERNAIYDAVYKGEYVEGSTLVCPWAACADCARAIIQTGVTTLITHQNAFDRSPLHWQESIQCAFDMMKEAGVKVMFVEGELHASPILMNGELWIP